VSLFDVYAAADPGSVQSYLHQLVDDLKAYLINHREWAGPILGAIAFGESLVLVGLFFPATVIMVFAGIAIQKDQLDWASVIGWSVLGASLGDLVTYWIGRWIGPGVVHRYPLNRDKTSVARARLFFRKYGFLAIFIGRFLGPVRPTIPLVAGIMRMRHLNFQIANVTSAMVWVPFMLFWGVIFSKAVGDLNALTTGHWIALLLFLIAVMVGISWAVVKMQGKSAKEMRQEEAKRRAKWHKLHDKPGAHSEHRSEPAPAPEPAPTPMPEA
jgi:membrane protein DedA with SNARE-associated domain